MSTFEVETLNAPGKIVQNSSPSVAFEIEIEETPFSVGIAPKRVIERLQKVSENKIKYPVSIEEIKAKLKEADLRRQRFLEWLANKAKPKAKSSTSSLPKDLAGKLAAKLFAAEQKRLDLLTQEQTRLAKLHELRVAAKTEAYLRAERERDELESKVEYRVQQAESNRLALLEAEKQRRALTHERVAQSVTQRMTQDEKDRERIEALRAAISQKIAAADEKRTCLLEAEKSRAKAIVLQARKVAKAVSRKKELELHKKREELEARLSRAKRQRAEYLQKRGGCRGSRHNHGHKNSKHGDRLCRKLTRCWRQFQRLRRTTYALAQEYTTCAINQQSVLSLPFEQLAARITSPGTLRSVKALLARIESRLFLSTSRQSGISNVDHLLKRLSPIQRKSGTAGWPGRRGIGSNKAGPQEFGKLSARRIDGHTTEGAVSERYPARVFLCAYMIMGHPDAVFSSRGDHEVALAEAAERLLVQFEALVSIILDGPSCSTPTSRPPSPILACKRLSPNIAEHETVTRFTSPTRLPSLAHEKQLSNDIQMEPSTPSQSFLVRVFSVQLVAFDAAWCSYLYHFVVWKVKDAQLLEDDLIRVACQLEVSMLQKCGAISEMDGSDGPELSHDFLAIQKQVLEDQKLFYDRIFHLTGQSGVVKMDMALSAVRVKYNEAKKNGVPLPSPFSFAAPCSSPSSSNEEERVMNKPRCKVARSLFASPDPKTQSSSGVISGGKDSLTDALVHFDNSNFTNEQIVNEMLHDPNWKKGMNIEKLFKERSMLSNDNHRSGNIQAQIKLVMEKAFWDSVLESLATDTPDYERVVSLVGEIRDDLAGIVPENWKQQLFEFLDVGVLRQVLNSGIKDFGYLRQLLDYTLTMIVKLGAPVRDDDTKLAHQNLLENISRANSTDTNSSASVSFTEALVQGIRFIFEQLQILKQDIYGVKLNAVASLVAGSAGVEYLQQAFTRRYDLPLRQASTGAFFGTVSGALPRTAKWVAQIRSTLEQEKKEIETSLAAEGASSTNLEDLCAPSQPTMPLSMCTGGRLAKVMQSSPTHSDEEFVVTSWDSLHTILRLGILHVACSSEGATEDTLPETLMLNLNRIRAAQNAFQHIVVMATGLLLVRQELAKAKVSGSQLEDVMSSGVSQLDSLLNGPSVTVTSIGALLARLCSLNCDDESLDVLQQGDLLARVLERSLHPDDHVFRRITGAIKASVRAVLILGTGKEGNLLAESALRKVGGISLFYHISKLAATLQALATVTCKVHRGWYLCLNGSV